MTKDFKCISVEALVDLRRIIAAVDKQCAFKNQITPMFMYGDHHRAVFQCSIEYNQRDIKSQIQGLDKLNTLMEYVHDDASDKWRLPTGRTLTRRWHTKKLLDNSYAAHMEITEENILDSTLSEAEGDGGFSFSIGWKALNIGYSQRTNAKIGVLVGFYP